MASCWSNATRLSSNISVMPTSPRSLRGMRRARRCSAKPTWTPVMLQPPLPATSKSWRWRSRQPPLPPNEASKRYASPAAASSSRITAACLAAGCTGESEILVQSKGQGPSAAFPETSWCRPGAVCPVRTFCRPADVPEPRSRPHVPAPTHDCITLPRRACFFRRMGPSAQVMTRSGGGFRALVAAPPTLLRSGGPPPANRTCRARTLQPADLPPRGPPACGHGSGR